MQDNNNFVELLGADIAKNEQLLKEQPIIAPEPYNGADFGYNKGLSDEQIQEIAKASKLDLKTDAEKPGYTPHEEQKTRQLVSLFNPEQFNQVHEKDVIFKFIECCLHQVFIDKI